MEKIANNPEKREGIADDARKFIVTDIDPQLLDGEDVVKFDLTIDWLETGEDDEAKIVLKEFPDGTVERILVAKVTENGKRTTNKEEMTLDEYEEEKARASSVGIGIEKTRYEFRVERDGIVFDVKYDEFPNSDLRLIEVDADNEEGRKHFDPAIFLVSNLKEVTGDRGYEGYRVADKT